MTQRGLFKPTASALCAALVAAAVSVAGCGKDQEEPPYRVEPGRVASVDLNTSAVKMWWYSAKQQKEILLEGTLAPNAEILINGRTARLEDIHVDDPVRVTGRIEKREGQKSLIATVVEVTRPEAGTAVPATQPAHAVTATQKQP